jgi:hypothetical protein
MSLSGNSPLNMVLQREEYMMKKINLMLYVEGNWKSVSRVVKVVRVIVYQIKVYTR